MYWQRERVKIGGKRENKDYYIERDEKRKLENLRKLY
jgi:hypothetical protein